MACFTTLMWIPVLDQGAIREGVNHCGVGPSMGESLCGTPLFCSSRFSAWDKTVSPGGPIGNKGIFLSRASDSVSVSFTQVEGPLIKEFTMALFCCCLGDFAQCFKDWQQHHLIPSGRQRQ